MKIFVARNIRMVLVLTMLSTLLTSLMPSSASTSMQSTLSTHPVQSNASRAFANFGRVPLAFEANRGQTDATARFVARGGGYNVFLAENETVLALDREDAPATALRMHLQNASRPKSLTASNPLAGQSHYLRREGNISAPRYGRVRYESVYPGVDVEYYGHEGQLEYDFLVAPHADPHRIVMRWEGASKLEIKDGNLWLHNSAGTPVLLRAPVAYQELDGARREVEVGFKLNNAREVAFELGGYDRTQKLVIDPVLEYSAFVGGRDNDAGLGIAVDRGGSAYITGVTSSLDFPARGVGGALARGNDVFIVKLNPSGTDIEYAAYFGGAGEEVGNAIVVDESGSAVVTGYTNSRDFPIERPQQFALRGGLDAFVVKLDATGSRFVFSTFLGGREDDMGADIAVDRQGDFYVAGTTGSTDFPVLGRLQNIFGGGTDAFVTKISATGQIMYGSFVGGRGDDEGHGVAVNYSGSAVVTGSTGSDDLPVRNAFQSRLAPDSLARSTDAFAAKINAAGTAFEYSTYLGGSENDRSLAVALDDAGNAYVAGFTESANFPVKGLLQAQYGGAGDAFLTVLNSGGSGIEYSTFIGGSDYDAATGVAVDVPGGVHLVGQTYSDDLKTQNTLQPAFGGGSDAFVAQIYPRGVTFGYVSYLGGTGEDFGADISLDLFGNVLVTGATNASNFPSAPGTSSLGRARGRQDAFVIKIGNDWSTQAAPSVVPGFPNTGNGVPGVSYLPGNAPPTIDPYPPVNSYPPTRDYPPVEPSRVRDTTEPRVRITTPRDRADMIDRLDEIGGEAFDERGGSGLERVEVVIRHPDGRFWDGRGWGYARRMLSTELFGDSWRITRNLPGRNLTDNGRYRIEAFAYDFAGNVGRANIEFGAGDPFNPTVFFSHPRNGQRLSRLTEVSGRVENERVGWRGVERVVFTIRRPDGRYWDGQNWQNREMPLPTSLDRRGVWRNAGNLPDVLTVGVYQLEVIAFNRSDDSNRTQIIVHGTATSPVATPTPGATPDRPRPTPTAGAPRPTARPNPTSAPATFRLSGRITTNTGFGLRGVTVALNNGATTQTDNNGRFSFDGLPPARYQVTPAYTGLRFEPANRAVTLNSNQTNINFAAAVGSTPLANPTPTPVPRPTVTPRPKPTAAPKPVPTATPRPSPTATPRPKPTSTPRPQQFTISGRVTSATGFGLRGVTIRLSNGDRTTTGSDGSFSFRSVEAGNYTVSPSFAGLNFAPGTQSVRVGPNAGGVNFTASK